MRILLISGLNHSEIVVFPAVPRIGDTLPLFYTPSPKVNCVCWLPEKLLPELAGTGIDAVITVERV